MIWDDKLFIEIDNKELLRIKICLFYPLLEARLITNIISNIYCLLENQTGRDLLNYHFPDIEEPYSVIYPKCYFPRSPNHY